LCANCGKCRDWYYTGDSKTWQWIRRAKDWNKEERSRWRNGDYYKDFKRRDGYTCTGLDLDDHFGYDVDDYGFGVYGGGGVGLGLVYYGLDDDLDDHFGYYY
ncbi:unnamed protein product, partial [Rotaria magnacalcarata]